MNNYKKSQIPNPNIQTNLNYQNYKHQNYKIKKYGKLDFVICKLFGIWDLGF